MLILYNHFLTNFMKGANNSGGRCIKKTGSTAQEEKKVTILE